MSPSSSITRARARSRRSRAGSVRRRRAVRLRADGQRPPAPRHAKTTWTTRSSAERAS